LIIFVTPLIARQYEGSEVAAAEAKRAERHHDDEFNSSLIAVAPGARYWP
jgi:hypothetical protein